MSEQRQTPEERAESLVATLAEVPGGPCRVLHARNPGALGVVWLFAQHSGPERHIVMLARFQQSNDSIIIRLLKLNHSAIAVLERCGRSSQI